MTDLLIAGVRCLVCLASTGVNAPETILPSWN